MIHFVGALFGRIFFADDGIFIVIRRLYFCVAITTFRRLFLCYIYMQQFLMKNLEIHPYSYRIFRGYINRQNIRERI